MILHVPEALSVAVRQALGGSLLFQAAALPEAIQSLRARVSDEDPALIALTGVYHNLLRLWSR